MAKKNGETYTLYDATVKGLDVARFLIDALKLELGVTVNMVYEAEPEQYVPVAIDHKDNIYIKQAGREIMDVLADVCGFMYFFSQYKKGRTDYTKLVKESKSYTEKKLKEIFDDTELK